MDSWLRPLMSAVDYIRSNHFYIRPSCSSITEYEHGSLKKLISESFLQSTLAIVGEKLVTMEKRIYRIGNISVSPNFCFSGAFGDVLVVISSEEEDLSLTYLFLCARAHTEAGNRLRISVLVNLDKDTIRYCVFSNINRTLPESREFIEWRCRPSIEQDSSDSDRPVRRRGRPRTRPPRDTTRGSEQAHGSEQARRRGRPRTRPQVGIEHDEVVE